MTPRAAAMVSLPRHSDNNALILSLFTHFSIITPHDSYRGAIIRTCAHFLGNDNVTNEGERLSRMLRFLVAPRS